MKESEINDSIVIEEKKRKNKKKGWMKEDNGQAKMLILTQAIQASVKGKIENHIWRLWNRYYWIPKATFKGKEKLGKILKYSAFLKSEQRKRETALKMQNSWLPNQKQIKCLKGHILKYLKVYKENRGITSFKIIIR